MKYLLFFFSIVFFSQNLYSQGRTKKKLDPSEGGFIVCKFKCVEHSRNCRFWTGHHIIDAYDLNSGQVFGHYEGNFLAGRFNGEGHETNPTLDFKGTYLAGYMKDGRLILPGGDTLVGEFGIKILEDKEERWYFKNGDIVSYTWYTLGDPPDEKTGSRHVGDNMYLRGHVENGKLNGKVYFKVQSGIYEGTEFDGYFEDGKINGCGIMKVHRTDDYLAPETTDNDDGYITFKSLNPDGDIFYGQFENSMYNGWGILLSENFDPEVGYWKNDILYTDYSTETVLKKLKDICGYDVSLKNDYSEIHRKNRENSLLIQQKVDSITDKTAQVNTTITFRDTTVTDCRGNESSAKLVKYELDYSHVGGTVKGDYPPGKFELNKSANAMLLLSELSETFKVMQQEYEKATNKPLIDANSVVRIYIQASSDTVPIRRPIRYKSPDTSVYPLKIIDSSAYTQNKYGGYSEINLSLTDGKIRYNSQLAYLRALGVMDYIKKNISFATPNIKYYIKIDTSSSHRTIGVEFFIRQNNEEEYTFNEKIKREKRAETNIPQLKKTPKEQKAMAILIYIDDYKSEFLKDDPLKFAKSDAELLGKYFSQTLGIQNIKYFYNQDASISDFADIFENQIPEWSQQGFTDFYIYFQGHGYANSKGSLYFLPWNTKFDKGGNLRLDLIDSLSGYLSKASNASTSNTNFFVIFDACASYSADKAMPVRTDKITSQNKICLISASKLFEVAKNDYELEHSLLSYAFVLALSDYSTTDKNNDGQITFSEIYSFVHDYVYSRSFKTNIYNSYRQEPQKFGRGNWNKVIIDTKKLKK